MKKHDAILTYLVLVGMEKLKGMPGESQKGVEGKRAFWGLRVMMGA